MTKEAINQMGLKNKEAVTIEFNDGKNENHVVQQGTVYDLTKGEPAKLLVYENGGEGIPIELIKNITRKDIIV